MNFTISLLSFDGPVYFNDTDGVLFPPLQPKNDIFILNATFDWTSNPIILPGSGAHKQEYSADLSDLETELRLYDQLCNSLLYVDVRGGTLGMKLGGFTVSIPDIWIRNILVVK